ncbi:YggN family protein [Thalassotalea sp. M1531]|uniref:YggN family protein n=1 Tax=Thalassotalea algicola TaxID=2716224 RepID=A0A7Y0LFQ6_9GAMM|nr:YggN family protein [Thalassotalea algicola]NMP33327.1 YggN family protein [Thalassotalea algicola]
MKSNIYILAGLIAASVISTPVNAEHCNVNFNYGVIIDPSHVRILNHGQTYVQITNNEQLFIGGREIVLNEQQQTIINSYSQGIRDQVPQIVSIAIEGVEIGLKAVNKVIGGLTGENSATHRKLQEKFDEMQMRLRKKFNHSNENYYIAPQDFDDFDEIFAGEFEQEIEEIVSESIGTILMAVGEAMANRDEETIEQRVDTFDDRIESMGEDLKLEIGTKAHQLEERAQQFCQALSDLDQIETEIQITIPKLADYNLISSERKLHE